MWREKIVPTLGIVMIDEKNHRSDGKIVGVGDTEDMPLSNFPVASYCQRLSTIQYPKDLWTSNYYSQFNIISIQGNQVQAIP